MTKFLEYYFTTTLNKLGFGFIYYMAQQDNSKIFASVDSNQENET